MEPPLFPEKCIVDGHEVGTKCGSLAKIRKDANGGLEYVPFDGITACCNLDLKDDPALEGKIAEIPAYIASCPILGALYHPHQADAYHWTTYDIKTIQDVQKTMKISNAEAAQEAYENLLQDRSNFTSVWKDKDECLEDGSSSWAEVAKAIDQQNLCPELRLLSAEFNPHRAQPALYRLTNTGAPLPNTTFSNGIDGSGSQGCLHLGNGIFLNDTSIKLEGECKVGTSTCGRRTTENRDGKCNVIEEKFLAGSHDKDIAAIGKLVYGKDMPDSHREWHMTIAYAHSPKLIEMRIERLGRDAVIHEFQELLAGARTDEARAKADGELAKKEFQALVEFKSPQYSEDFYKECQGLKDLIDSVFGRNVIPVKKNQLTLFKDMSVFYEWNGNFYPTGTQTETGESYKEISCRHIKDPSQQDAALAALVAQVTVMRLTEGCRARAAQPFRASHSMSCGALGTMGY